MFKKIIFVTLYFNLSNSYSTDSIVSKWGKFTGFMKNKFTTAKDMIKGFTDKNGSKNTGFIGIGNGEIGINNEKENDESKDKETDKNVTNNEDKNDESKDKETDKNVTNNEDKNDESKENKEVKNSKEDDKKDKENVEKNTGKDENKDKENKTKEDEKKELKLKMNNISDYEYYDKINETFKKKLNDLRKDDNNEIEIKIEIDKNEKNVEGLVKGKIRELFDNAFELEEIKLNNGKTFLMFSFGDYNSFTIKDLIIPKELEKIKNCETNLNVEIDKNNINDYKKKFGNFKKAIEKIEKNKFYSEYYKTLESKCETIKNKIQEFLKKNLSDEQENALNNFKKKIDDRFTYIFNVNNFESYNDDKKEEVKDIFFGNKYNNICNDMKSKYNDDILKDSFNVKINEKKTQIQDYLKKFLTKVKLDIKEGKKLKKQYHQKFEKIINEYQNGKFENLCYNDIINDLKTKMSTKLQLEETETIDFYKKEGKNYIEINTETDSDENKVILEKDKTHYIYLEFPERFYFIKEDDEYEEVEEEQEQRRSEDKEKQKVEVKKGCSCKKKGKKGKGKCSGKEKREKLKHSEKKQKKGCSGKKNKQI